MKRLKNRNGPNIYWHTFNMKDTFRDMVSPVLYFDYYRNKESRHSLPNFNYDKDEWCIRIGSCYFKDKCFELTFTPNQKEWLKYANQEWSGYKKLISGALFK